MDYKNIFKHGSFRGIKVLLFFMILFQVQCTKDESKPNQGSRNFYRSNYALVIGIDNFENKEWATLKNAIKDASLVGEELESMGFKVIRKFNKNLQQLKQAFEAFFINEGIDENSRLFVWFSGHAYTAENKGYLVPVDAPPGDDTAFKGRALPISRISGLAKQTLAKHVYMVFDTCFSDTAFSNSQRSSGSQPIAAAIKFPVRQYLISCSDGSESTKLRELFIKSLKNEVEADANNDDYLTAGEIGQFITHEMGGGNQSPQFGKFKDFDQGNFVFSLNSKPSVGNNLVISDYLPEMVVIPQASPETFLMGDVQGGGYKDEKPVHTVKVNKIAVSRFEITFDEYDHFCNATGQKKPDDNGWGRGNRPVINVSWEDAKVYTNWLSEQTGHTYRLPKEAEWEYFARAGTETQYWWGNEYEKNRAACDLWDTDGRTVEVGSFDPNPFGIYDTVGNVWEWTCSEYTDRYDKKSNKETKCLNKITTGGEAVVLRGGAWDEPPKNCRAARRKAGYPGERSPYIGFRVVRELKEG